ncbi:glycosyltransferase group 1 family protein [Bacillus sp. NRRL B-14911]|uniref:Glycosyl transferase n=1 Tax=Bacillus infantis NRRL B-14911 TaxID=1367477 RepID=U5LIQ0_9BACI|nr:MULTISPECIES: glycosyltransferase family 4 protein [Bacillus]AGX06512.1 glycosyl transferase [Bacillus infantis NRRL B-14911]EAR68557.1 glycosyltransferase group 1 family protein [Bacillus sp. NRRL B-14911]
MKILHLISGGETGGSKNHLLSLLSHLKSEDILLGVFQEGKLAQEARELGIPLVFFNQKSRYDLSILSRIKKVIKDEGITIVHTHGPRANLFAYMVRKMIPFKWVTTIHSNPEQDFIKGGIKGRVFTAINMNVIRKIDHFFAVSERFKSMITGFGIPAGKITTIYNGISFDKELKNNLTRGDLGLSEEEFAVIMVARLHPIKGHTVVFDAFQSLLKKRPDTTLLLIGDGPIREELEKEAARKGIAEKVRFLGFHDDVHSYLSLSDVKLLASYSESFPLVILEAARAHVPVISTDVGGVKDLISDPSLGWIVPVKDASAIESAILAAAEEKDQRKLSKMGEKLYEKASALYSVKQLADQTLETYKKI